MHGNVLLLVELAHLAATASTYERENGIVVLKCCSEYEMLSADGESCVDAPWLHNASLVRGRFRKIVPPLDEEWVERWLPSGLPMHNISYVLTSQMISGTTISVNSSSLWNSSLLQNEDLFRNTIAYLGGGFSIARPRPGGGFRGADYCVDAAPLPQGPFMMRFRTLCSEEECATKCCYDGQLLKKNETGHWVCEDDDEGNWTPGNSALALDTEFPYMPNFDHRAFRLTSWEVRDAQGMLIYPHFLQLHFSTSETCFDFYRSSDGSLHEGLSIYEEIPRITRGVYWLLRPLCFLSALLLLASLVSVACDKSMRRKIHARCLATHAACLFAFNIGQIWYYIAISDRLDDARDDIIPKDLQGVCKYVALWLYFLLTSAWCWLTALCANMAKGFSLQAIRPKKESRKRFLALSAFAWGLPVLMTTTCSFLLSHDRKWREVHWFYPSLAESRVCYNEYIMYAEFKIGNDIYYVGNFLKSGTALFYFGPVACLVICNTICLVKTLRKVQYLKQGNSVLRREEDLIPLGQRHPEGNNPPSSHTATGHEGRHRTSVDAKTIKLYIKMILMSGGIELLTEIIMWSTTVYNEGDLGRELDLDLAYRAAGYVTDLFRAAVVAWLAAPEGGYLGLVRRLRPGKGEQKPAPAGGAGRRKQNAA